MKQADKTDIERILFKHVTLLIESQYNLECIIDKSKKNSRKIIFKDKKTAIEEVAKAIEEFSKERNLDKEEVKDYLLDVFENRIKLGDIYKEILEQEKEIILIQIEDEGR